MRPLAFSLRPRSPKACMRMGKIETSIAGHADGFVQCQIFSVVTCDGMDVLRQRRKKLQDGRSDANFLMKGDILQQTRSLSDGDPVYKTLYNGKVAS